jgi:hypothetical protein
MENLIHRWKKIINNEKPQEIEEPVTKDLISSQISERSNKFKKSSRAASKDNLSPMKQDFLLFNQDCDKLAQILTKTITYINKNGESCNYQKILENLNEAMDIHVQNINNNKIHSKKFEEKEVIWQTKCETADKMIKDFELKILTSEKEKVIKA